MTEIAAQEHQRMSDGSASTAPARDYAGGEGVAKIVDTRPGSIAVAPDAVDQFAKMRLDDVLAQRPGAAGDEK